jgi:hypothetical protein
MKPLHYLLAVIIATFFCPNLSAQPFSMDAKIKPVKLELIDDEKVEGASGVITNATIDKDPQYWFANVDMFRPIDVYLFSNYGSPDFEVDIANTNWEDVVETQNTGSAENGIIHFQIRTEGDFGIHVRPGSEDINYTLIIYANPPIKEFLGSAFRKARPNEFKIESSSSNAGATNGNSDNSGDSSNNTLLYIVLGVALLVIGFLLAMVLNKRKSASIVLLFLLGSVQSGMAQQHSGNVWGPNSQEEYGNWLTDRTAEERPSGYRNTQQIVTGLSRMGSLGNNATKAMGTYGAAKGAYEAYTGLNSCMNSASPPGMPKIPSFCETDDCERCFVDARGRFNQNRYTFERLKTIYTCTKNFTDRMIAFGDNVSGYHGVSGLAWQSQKIGVIKSVNNLKTSYDKKYAELIQSQQEILQELNDCEAAHGIEDWYDRFGYLYFEFTKMNYVRKD